MTIAAISHRTEPPAPIDHEHPLATRAAFNSIDCLTADDARLTTWAGAVLALVGWAIVAAVIVGVLR